VTLEDKATRPEVDMMVVTTERPPARHDHPASAWQRPGPYLPGLAVVAGAVGAAYLVAFLVPDLNASTVGVLIGALLVNSGLHRPALRAGTQFAGHRLLRVAIVLLGLQLSLRQLGRLGLPGLAVVITTVTVTFVGTQLLGRRLGVSPTRSLLVATGFSICGASAVAGMRDVAGGDDDDVAVAVALVTLCGSLAILLLPALRVPLGLDPQAFGDWVGASVHDVGQTLATASRVPGSLQTAVVVKLTRVLLLAPLVAGVAVRRARSTSTVGLHRPPVIPLFVAGFLGAVALSSTGALPTPLLDVAHDLQQVLLTAALVGLGTGISVPMLRRSAGRAVLLGLVSWLLVASVSYAGVVLVR
jgi:uncharacterized integral membrane protein (TIGR00698 family)